MTYPPPAGSPEPYGTPGQSGSDDATERMGGPPPDPTFGAPSSGGLQGYPAAPDYQQPSSGAPAPGAFGAAPGSGVPGSGVPGSGVPGSGVPGSGVPGGYPPGPYASNPYAPPAYAQSYGGPQTRTNALAIASLACSCAGFFTCISAPVGIVLGHIAKRQIKETGEQGDGLATAGLWVGYAVTALGLVTIVGMIFIFAIIGSTAGGS